MGFHAMGWDGMGWNGWGLNISDDEMEWGELEDDSMDTAAV
jgi:hypothetical protein